MPSNYLLLIISFVVSFGLVWWIHPRIVKIARMNNIVDKPNARKLQSEPIPVLGGVAVFFGMVVGIGFMSTFVALPSMLVVVTAMMAMLYTGTMDDVLDLSPSLRFGIEIAVVLCLIFGGRGNFLIDDFHGLWGIHRIPEWVAWLLTVFAAVGIVNAINLIDGVNGLCSGYCITACFIFGTFFYCTHNVPMTLLAAVSAGALFPFFFHNVFGRTSRMFIGDGGTLVMGIVMAIFVCEVLRYDGNAVFGCGEQIPFTLAVLCIPVFDTLRVMSMRWWRGVSPFHPDKTHLHHLFIALGCSHPMTTAAILTLNSGVVFCWWVAAMLGASCEVQLYLVVGLSTLFTFGLYPVLGTQLRRNTRFFHWLRWLGYHTHLSRTRFFLMFRNFVDKH